MTASSSPSKLQRWKIVIEYDGTNYVGWQRQKKDMSVQQAMEEAVEKLSGEPVTLHTAGRTDAGVHALGQVAHFDLEKDLEPRNIRDGINHLLYKHSIAVLSAEPVPTEFHARFDAKKRYYSYHLTANRRAPAIIDGNRCWRIKHSLDVNAMHKAAQHLIGKHDFSTFRDAECQAKSPIKTIDTIKVYERDDLMTMGQHIFIDVCATSFLHHQIRNITGTLKLVGEGKWTSGDVKHALEKCDRTQGGPTAPPQGLYFMCVDY